MKQTAGGGGGSCSLRHYDAMRTKIDKVENHIPKVKILISTFKESWTLFRKIHRKTPVPESLF